MYFDILAFIYYYFNTKITSLVVTILFKAVHVNVFIINGKYNRCSLFFNLFQ